MTSYVVIAFLFQFGLQFCHCDNAAIGIKDREITLPCQHTHSEKDILKIFWQVNDVNQPAVEYKPADSFPLDVYNRRLAGRADIDFPTGDLILHPVKWDDAGTYNCFIVLTSGAIVTLQRYMLTVHVVPDRVVVNCSDSPSTVPDRPCSQVDSPVRISCSVTSSPKSEIKWTTKPDGCSEVESKYCSAGDSPSVCVSELEDLCAGTYACQVMYDNNIVQKDIPGGKVTVNGKAGGGSTMEQKTETWKITLITIILIVVCAVVILSVSILLAKKCCGNSGRRESDQNPCVKNLYSPCFCGDKFDRNRPMDATNHQNSQHTEQVPLHVHESNRSTSDHDSSEEDNPSNSVTERKQVRPEILQAIEAAKSLAEAPAASRVNFMVTTIGGTKYKFDIEKEGKASHSRSGSMDNFDSGGGGDGSRGVREMKTRSIKGPSEGQSKQPKIDVEEVD